jgi:hypothetical protein
MNGMETESAVEISEEDLKPSEALGHIGSVPYS